MSEPNVSAKQSPIWVLIVTVILAAVFVAVLSAGWWVTYQRVTLLESILRIMVNAPTGITRKQMERDFGRRGRIRNTGKITGFGVDLRVPPGGYVALYDSYLVSPFVTDVGFAVVLDRHDRVVSLSFVGLPLGYGPDGRSEVTVHEW